MSIVLESLTKTFGSHPVVSEVSLEISAGELFVLLGPSGSGKSTVLRLIAGLLEQDGGRVLLHGRDVTGVPPQKRGVGLVFQHYALFRHMTVAENIEFALKIRRVRAGERRRRRDELLELVGLAGLGGRLPHQLSGGQQQRVALARALAHRPELLLLDEPFGALDAKIRADLRRSFRRIQSELGVTTLFVTHDQEEGFELADRLGVMNFGRLLEVGPPRELYFRPKTEFVATFLGKANLMVGECDASSVLLGPLRLPLDGRVTAGGEAHRIQVLFRPEDVAVEESADALTWPKLGMAEVEEVDFSGSIERLRLRLPRLRGVRSIAPPVPFGADYTLLEALRSQDHARRFPLAPGDRAWVGVRRLHALLHPGLHLLLVLDDPSRASSVLALGEELARQAHARITVLGIGDDRTIAQALAGARKTLGTVSGSLELRASGERSHQAILQELERLPYDLVLHSWSGKELLERSRMALEAGCRHLLRLPPDCIPPRRVLICVAVGEPGKEDMAFAGRLFRHLGASATILTVQPPECPEELIAQGQRFLEAGVRSLSLFQVPARAVVRRGRLRSEIAAEIEAGGHDLVVVGAPLPGRDGRISLEGTTGELLAALSEIAVLVVRSQPDSALQRLPLEQSAVA